jgi:2-methylisocitrate lyase-like PEP mutase family enzyme
VLSKRCGHLLGKQVVSEEEFLSRIRAMVIERQRINSDILIIARSDAAQELGVEEAIKRCKAAVVAGADIAFVEAIQNEDEAKKVVSELHPTPCLLNMVPHGVTPNWSKEKIQELGFKLAIYPGVALRGAATSVAESLKELYDNGKVADVPDGSDVKQFFMTMGLKQFLTLDQLAGGSTFKKI